MSILSKLEYEIMLRVTFSCAIKKFLIQNILIGNVDIISVQYYISIYVYILNLILFTSHYHTIHT